MALWSSDVDVANKTVTYDYGLHQITKEGGSLSWRNNNPGNLSYGSEAGALKNGAIGVYPLGKWNYGVFPTEEAGQKALDDWLDKNGNKSVSDAMEKYAPSVDNDTDAYREHLATKLDIEKPINDLSDKERTALTDAIRQHEGYNAGKETEKLSDDLNIKNDAQLKDLMQDLAYSNPNNPRYEDAQNAANDYFDKKYPGDMKPDETGKMCKEKVIYVWHTEICENTCEECDALNGTIYDSLDEIDELPPLHPNCNCSVEEEIIEE